MPSIMKQRGSGLLAASDKVQAALLSGLGFNAGEVGASTGSNCPNPNYGVLNVDFTDADWNTEAFQCLFAITGNVHLRMLIECVTVPDSATDTATIALGSPGSATTLKALIDDTAEADIPTGTFWCSAVAANNLKVGTFANAIIDVVSIGTNIGLDINGEALTTGEFNVHYVWEPMSVGATCVEGAGEAS